MRISIWAQTEEKKKTELRKLEHFFFKPAVTDNNMH